MSTPDEKLKVAQQEGETSLVEKMESAMDERQEYRREGERVEQQDLNQGSVTGTHDSARHGVNWGRSYRVRSEEIRSQKP